MELVIKLHRHMRDLQLPYRIDFIAEPVCWTKRPEDMGCWWGTMTRKGFGEVEPG